MRYGHFDEGKREYVIDRPDTPMSWSNYIGSRTYGGIVTNNAGGYSFYRTSGAGRFTRLTFNSIPMDQPGKYFYIRDDDSGDFWSASWQPVGKPLDKYRSVCRFGLGYAVIESEYSGIRSESTYYSPLGENFEYWRLKLTNNSKRKRSLSITTYAEFTMEWNIFQDAFNLQYTMYILRTRMVDGFVEASINRHLKEDPANFANRDQSRWSWMTLLGAKITGHDLDREKFIGSYRSYNNPICVEEGKCSSSEAYGNNGCGGLQTKISLKPGETREIMVLLGVGRVEREGRRVLKKFGSAKKADDALAKIATHWKSRLANLQVETPDKEMNQMLNTWGAYNSLMTFYWCRSASLVYSGDNRDGFGFRDTVQDIMGASSLLDPGEIRERLEIMLTGQESNGGAMPEVKPFAHHPGKMPLTDPAHQRSDDCLWFFNAIPAYVNESGDFGFYRKILPYSDKGRDTVFKHLRRALEFNLERTGAHGLPCGLYADWDDCIRMGFKGETVMVAFQVRWGLVVFADVAGRLGELKEKKWAEKELAKIDGLIQRHCWDGAWFVRGYKDNGELLGSRRNKEGMIHHNVQSFAVMSGGATKGQARKAMDSVEKFNETKYGCMALMPPVVEAECRELRMVLMHPGEKENAGIFSHSQGWIIMANCMLGDGDRAYRVYRANLPARFNDMAEIRKIEPYVYCQTTSSRYSKREGMSHVPWLTGAASWSYYAPTQYILGIRPEFEGLRIDPCIPSEWKGFKAERMFRGRKISICVRNPDGKSNGVKKLILNGEELGDNLVPVEKLKTSNEVLCLL